MQISVVTTIPGCCSLRSTRHPAIGPPPPPKDFFLRDDWMERSQRPHPPPPTTTHCSLSLVLSLHHLQIAQSGEEERHKAGYHLSLNSLIIIQYIFPLLRHMEGLQLANYLCQLCEERSNTQSKTKKIISYVALFLASFPGSPLLSGESLGTRLPCF